jgi:methyltransferase (TIGR00027 family)
MLGASDTAFTIATIRAQEAELPAESRLFDDPYAATFAAAGAHAAEGTQRFLALPFFRDGIRLRVRGIDDIVRERIAAGDRQLVLMGAGFDSRALRLPEVVQRGVRVFEIDQPDVVEQKRSLLSAANVGAPAHVAHLPCDFTSPELEAELTASLVAAGFDRSAATVFVWEGVIPYIGVAAAARLLRFMGELNGPHGTVVFDCTDAIFDPSTAADFARGAGFAHCEETSFDTLWRRHLPGEPHPTAEIIKLVRTSAFGA